MSQEKIAQNSEGTPRKRTQPGEWINLGSVLLLSTFAILMALRGSGPLNPVSLEGSAVILDENGEPIPYREIVFTFYSHYAPGFFRSEESRKRNYYIDEQGFGRGFGGDTGFPLKIPKAAATLFFHTRNGKYAAVVDIDPNGPTTGLGVELRPRHSATGRLVDHVGAPLANYEFSLDFQRTPDFGFRNRVVFTETLESVPCETDADGLFTVDRLIPGVEYYFRFHRPGPTHRYTALLKMPILLPEQYQEPYSLGDVSVR